MASPRLPQLEKERKMPPAMTERDWTIVQHLADGYRYGEVAQLMGLTGEYVKQLTHKMFLKEGAWSCAELVARGFRKGKIS